MNFVPGAITWVEDEAPTPMPPPRTTLPQSVRIGYRTYAVKAISPIAATSREMFGECDNCLGEIRIRADLDPVKQANTLLHEVLHACWYVANVDDGDNQERTVTALANILTQVWRDNPELVAFLAERLC